MAEAGIQIVKKYENFADGHNIKVNNSKISIFHYHL